MLQAVYDAVRREVAFYETDREIQPDIQSVERLVRSGALQNIVHEMLPDFR